MVFEENVRQNRIHNALLRLAPDAWEQFKTAFFAERDEIGAEPTLITKLVCNEPDKYTFDVNLERPRTPPIGALTFRFDPLAPCIFWTDLHNKKPAKRIELKSDGEIVVFLLENSPLVLQRFVEDCLSKIL